MKDDKQELCQVCKRAIYSDYVIDGTCIFCSACCSELKRHLFPSITRASCSVAYCGRSWVIRGTDERYDDMPIEFCPFCGKQLVNSKMSLPEMSLPGERTDLDHCQMALKAAAQAALKVQQEREVLEAALTITVEALEQIMDEVEAGVEDGRVYAISVYECTAKVLSQPLQRAMERIRALERVAETFRAFTESEDITVCGVQATARYEATRTALVDLDIANLRHIE